MRKNCAFIQYFLEIYSSSETFSLAWSSPILIVSVRNQRSLLWHGSKTPVVISCPFDAKKHVALIDQAYDMFCCTLAPYKYTSLFRHESCDVWQGWRTLKSAYHKSHISVAFPSYAFVHELFSRFVGGKSSRSIYMAMVVLLCAEADVGYTLEVRRMSHYKWSHLD